MAGAAAGMQIAGIIAQIIQSIASEAGKEKLPEYQPSGISPALARAIRESLMPLFSAEDIQKLQSRAQSSMESDINRIIGNITSQPYGSGVRQSRLTGDIGAARQKTSNAVMDISNQARSANQQALQSGIGAGMNATKLRSGQEAAAHQSRIQAAGTGPNYGNMAGNMSQAIANYFATDYNIQRRDEFGNRLAGVLAEILAEKMGQQGGYDMSGMDANPSDYEYLLGNW